MAREGLEELGLRVHSSVRDEPQRLGFTYLEANGERTITLVGEKLHPHGSDPLPWGELAGDRTPSTSPPATRMRCGQLARPACSSRPRASCRRSQKPASQLDALVHSASDSRGDLRAGSDRAGAELVVTTRGREGGTYAARGRRRRPSTRVRFPARSRTPTGPATASPRARLRARERAIAEAVRSSSPPRAAHAR